MKNLKIHFLIIFLGMSFLAMESWAFTSFWDTFSKIYIDTVPPKTYSPRPADTLNRPPASYKTTVNELVTAPENKEQDSSIVSAYTTDRISPLFLSPFRGSCGDNYERFSSPGPFVEQMALGSQRISEETRLVYTCGLKRDFYPFSLCPHSYQGGGVMLQGHDSGKISDIYYKCQAPGPFYEDQRQCIPEFTLEETTPDIIACVAVGAKEKGWPHTDLKGNVDHWFNPNACIIPAKTVGRFSNHHVCVTD